jgi:tetratricopeptide (TPR) repeat protein
MSLHPRAVAFLCAALVLTQTGCQKGLPDPASPAPALENADSPPPTGQEARHFAERMLRAVRARDAAAIDALLRLRDLSERLVSDLEVSPNERRSFLEGVAKALKRVSYGQQILQAIGDDGSYKLLRIRTVDGRPRPLFRMIHSDGRINYHEYVLARHKDGEVATEDVFILMTGERISQTMRRLVIPFFASVRNKSLLQKIAPDELGNLKTFGAMADAIRAGDFKSAVAHYRTLPRKYQEQKPVLIGYVQATMNLGADGEGEYLAALETFRKLYPDDAAVDFISIDYFYLKKQYDQARKAIDRLDQAVGGDPYLNVVRGNASMEAGRFEEARQAMEKAIQAEPDATNAYWVRISLALREKKHADTLKWLQAIVEKCHVEVQDLAAVPEYADFVKSPQYGEWQKWYAGRGKKDTP